MEHKNKISVSKKGSKLKISTKEKMSLSKKDANHPQSKLILNTQTGIFYFTIKEAAENLNMKYTTLKCQLNGQNKNKTSMIYA